MNNKNRKDDGFTLVEVMVALLVLSIGLLGVAGLQAKSQQFSRSAYLNTQATVLAHDMLERMRSNPAGLIAANYNLPAATSRASCYELAGCSPLEMAQNDMSEWATILSLKLPSGSAVVCIDASQDDGTPAAPACDGVGSVYAIKVWWHNLNAETQRVVTTAAF